MSVTKNIIDNEHVVEINTLTWNAKIVVSNNGNLIRLLHKPSGAEVLRTPETLQALREQPERYGMPLFFPLGRIAGGAYIWNNREYRYPLNDPENNCNLHGIILGETWNCPG